MPDDQPLSVRLLGAGVRGARSVGKATGIDRAVESAAEEAMVAAVESEAVERALARVLEGPLVEDAVHGALESEAVKRALIDALDSEMVDEVWRRMLASDETQRLVERIAEAPEIRAAISAQSVGFIEDIGHTIGDATRRIDTVVEGAARRVVFRKRRTEPTERAGALTRVLAFGLDLLIVNLAFSGLAAILALIGSFFSGTGNGLSGTALALGGCSGSALAASTWSSSGRSPGRPSGMRFFGIRLGVESARPGAAQIGQAAGRAVPGARSPSGSASSASSSTSGGAAGRTGSAGVDVLYEGRERPRRLGRRFDSPEPLADGGPGNDEGPGGPGPSSQQVAGPRLGNRIAFRALGQLVDDDDRQGEDRQRPERLGRERQQRADRVQRGDEDAEPAAEFAAGEQRERGDQLEHAEDQA